MISTRNLRFLKHTSIEDKCTRWAEESIHNLFQIKFRVCPISILQYSDIVTHLGMEDFSGEGCFSWEASDGGILGNGVFNVLYILES